MPLLLQFPCSLLELNYPRPLARCDKKIQFLRKSCFVTVKAQKKRELSFGQNMATLWGGNCVIYLRFATTCKHPFNRVLKCVHVTLFKLVALCIDKMKLMWWLQ